LLLIILLTGTASRSKAQVPGSVAPVTLALVVSFENPGTFKRAADGKIIGSGSNRIPVFSNNWGGWEEYSATIPARKYSNREFLSDLVNRNVIPGPITGWSLVRVMISSYDYENDVDYNYDNASFDDYTFDPGSDYPSVGFYVVKAGFAPVRVDSHLEIRDQAIIRSTRYLVNHDAENFSYRPFTPRFRCRVTGSMDIGLLGGTGASSFTGISDYSGARHRSVVIFGGLFVNIWVNRPITISNISGSGPNYSVGQGVTPSIISGTIKIGQGVIKDVSAFWGLD